MIKIKNNYNTCHTEINFWGIKFKFLNKYLIKRPNYQPVIEKIRRKYKNNETIRVGFLVSENAKWNAENLYNLLEQDESFEPVILLTLLTNVVAGKDKTRNNLDENYSFFQKTNKRIEFAYDTNKRKYLDLNNFNIDILFYQQPWFLDDIQNIDYVSKFALCCYYPYGIILFEEKKHEITPFHEKLYAYFLPDEQTCKSYSAYAQTGGDNLYAVGYPKLDIYSELEQPDKKDKKKIIYAPHFSYSQNSYLKISTFEKTGEKILDFASKHKEYDWIFKPHPNLLNTLYNDTKYGKIYADNYYAKWEKVGKIYATGNYFNLFINSDLLITDCDSFLLEYMPTLKPIIRLTRKDSLQLNDKGKAIIKGVYEATNFKNFQKIFLKLVVAEEDDLLNIRKNLVQNIKNKNASEAILEELHKSIYN